MSWVLVDDIKKFSWSIRVTHSCINPVLLFVKDDLLNDLKSTSLVFLAINAQFVVRCSQTAILIHVWCILNSLSTAVKVAVNQSHFEAFLL